MRPIRSACVVGAGAIGSLFAGHLASVVSTKALVRRKDHAAALNREGLSITGKSRRHAAILAATDPAALDDVDLVIVATKASAVKAAAERLAGHFADATVMTVQNGLGCEEAVACRGDWPIISSITCMSGVKHSDTHVEYELDTETWLGPWPNGGADFPAAQRICELLVSSGLKARAFADVRSAQWSKLIFNSVVNSIGAVTNLPHVKAFAGTERPQDLGKLVFAMMEEGRCVAAAERIELYEDPWEMNVRAVNRGQTGDDDYAHVFSMLSDVRARRPTEVDWLTGAIVREGRRLNVSVPLHELLYGLVKGVEQSWLLAGV
ncbi:MAG TPA: ketopantoate reductase family protein [Woeseiaceae bacterium]|nr:ketopantoate reductase family protein [Woeseiaceae bacterium]